MNIFELKQKLDALSQQYNTPQFIDNDPIQFPRLFTEIHDIEIAAFITATIAWGKRSMILNSANKLFSLMGHSPFDYVMSGAWQKCDSQLSIHRTFFGKDFIYMCRGFQKIYSEYDKLEQLFTENGNRDVWKGIYNFRYAMKAANEEVYSKHISNPGDENYKGSACKRLHLAMRWLVRNDNIVDLGVWTKLKPADLMIPLDVHVANTSRQFQLISRKANDRLAVEELTSILRTFDPDDPIKYDFALFGLGLEMQK